MCNSNIFANVINSICVSSFHSLKEHWQMLYGDQDRLMYWADHGGGGWWWSRCRGIPWHRCMLLWSGMSLKGNIIWIIYSIHILVTIWFHMNVLHVIFTVALSPWTSKTSCAKVRSPFARRPGSKRDFHINEGHLDRTCLRILTVLLIDITTGMDNLPSLWIVSKCLKLAHASGVPVRN